MSKRIVLIGPGAIGGITAAFLAKAGEDITVVCKHPSLTEQISGKGLHLTGICGDQWVPMKAVTTIEELEGVFDFCLIATKVYDMPPCARAMLPHLKTDSLVVSMQNGICTELLASVVGEERTIGCSIGLGGTMAAQEPVTSLSARPGNKARAFRSSPRRSRTSPTRGWPMTFMPSSIPSSSSMPASPVSARSAVCGWVK